MRAARHILLPMLAVASMGVAAMATTAAGQSTTTNLVPAQSSCFAGSGTGLWQPWYGSSVSRSTAETYGGCAASLAVQATEAQYVGVNWDNSPGVTGATAGTPYTLSYAAYGQAGTTFTAEFSWYNGTTALSTNDLNVTTNGGWAYASGTVMSPAKATGLFLDVRTTNAVNGAVYYLDDFQASPNGAPTTTTTVAPTTTTTVPRTTTTTVPRTTTTTVATTTTTTAPSGQTCSHPVWSSSSAAGSDSNFAANSGADYWSVNNDAWNANSGPQTMYVCNQSSWYVDSDQPNINGNVQTFPDSYYNIGGGNSTTPISGFTSISSTFSEGFPSAGGWDAGYDLWLKDGVETMIWNQWAGANGFWPTQATTSLTLDGVPYTFLDAGGELEFFRQPQAASGSVDILAAFDWLVKNGYVSASDVPATLQYGVEISYTSGTETFPLNGLTYSLGT